MTNGDVMTGGPAPPGFFQGINNSEAGAIISLAANCLGIYGFAAPLIAGLLGGSGSDQDVLDAIDRLAQELEEDFTQLGNLILQQIQLVLQNENTIALAEALAHSGTAMDQLTYWMRTGQDEALQSALNESDLGIQFFLALPGTAADPGQASQTQPYFLPGMTKAGTVRILALMARDGTELWRFDEDVTEVTNIIDLVEGMLASIRRSVTAAHTVTYGKIPGVADPVMWAYFHRENGRLLESFLAWIYATNAAGYAADQRRIVAALSSAEAARTAGIAAELDFIGVPHYQALIDSQWKVAITDPMRPILLVQTDDIS